MGRLMSVALTERQVRDRSKTVTRRLGWWEDRNGRRLIRPGDHITLCPKVMGYRKGERVERICDVEVVSVRRERLSAVDRRDVVAEGFPEMTPWEFREFFAAHMGVDTDAEVTRIEWRYLP